MRVPFVSICIGVLTAVVSDAAATSSAKPFKCNPNQCSEAAQQAAIKDVSDIFLVQKNVQKLFDEYIPGEYIQHDPLALSGRQNAIDILTPFFAIPGLTITPHAAFAGQGFGLLHYELSIPGATKGSPPTNLAIMDRYRFQGTCIVEHWDVSQQIFGNETNPIAFF